MAKVKTPSARLNARHVVGYGAGDCGGVILLASLAQMNRSIRNVLGVSPTLLAKSSLDK